MAAQRVPISTIVFDGSIYPRKDTSSKLIDQYEDAMTGGATFPPIILEVETNRLLDGYHRWKAYQRVGTEDVECEYHTIPERVTPKLYALSLSSKHGLRPGNKDKEEAAKEQYKQFPGTSIKDIAEYAGVSEPTAKKYVESLIAEFEETKRSAIMRLDLLGWTQQEISDKLQEMWPDAQGTTQMSVSNFLKENEDFIFLLKTDLSKGHDVKTLAQRYALPEILVWTIKLQDAPDQEKMNELGIKIQPYDYWTFQSCDDLYGSEYPGRIPGQLVAHALYFFTEPGDTIVDPMAGGGTTVDVCLAMGRKCYAYDLESSRFDILAHDMMTGWPDRVKKADFVFWDPPYFSKKDGDYPQGSISALGRDAYLDFFDQRLAELVEMARKGCKLAFLMSDWNDETGELENIFLWDYTDILRKHMKLIRHIQVPLSTQSVHGDIVNKFREAKRLARLERYLLIGELK